MQAGFDAPVNNDLDTLFATYGDMIYRLALVRTRSAADAEDVVQEVFLRCLKARPSFDSAEHQKAWLLKVTINCSKSLMTSAFRRHSVPEDAMGELSVDAEETDPTVRDAVMQLYRYIFADSLLIHAQRPDATACAELETWNNKMGRWVNRGAKGIALIDDSGPRKRLRYVFDISDTHMVRGGKTPYLWQMDTQLRPEMADYLMDTYGLDYDPDAPLSTVLMSLARAQVAENLEDAMDGLSYEIRGTYLEGLGEDAVLENFRRLLENSTYYMLARRCGLDPWDELTPDDFAGLSNFNRLSVLSFLGNAAHDIAEPVLKRD